MKNLPYTTLIINKVLEEIKKVEMPVGPIYSLEFETAFNLAKKEIVARVEKVEF